MLHYFTKLFQMLGILTLLTTVSALAEKRVAFVVGNGAYTHATPLDNPINDARAMSEKLRNLGFITVDGFDLTEEAFRERVRDFAKLAIDADLAIFFYAGHGIAVDGTNYLVPVDAEFTDPTALDFEAISVDFVAKQMQYSGGVNLLFLDACRNNPLARSLSRSMGRTSRSTNVSTGLAEMKITNPGRGLAIAFATSPGEVALDGEGDHSPFTSALLNHIDAPNTDITEIMGRVTGEVYNSTQQSQRPWLNTSLTGAVVLNPEAIPEPTPAAVAVATPEVGAAAGAVAAAPNTLEVEKTLFQMARDSDRIGDYQAYLETFPEGVFAAFARNAIKELKQKQADGQIAAVTPQAVQPAPATQPINNNGTISMPSFMVPTPQQPVHQQGQQLALLPTTPNTPGQPQQLFTNQQGFQQQRAFVNPTPQLVMTPQLRALPANPGTEAIMQMNRERRREIQARLNLTQNNVGTPDGSFGPRTRAGIQNWQAQQGLLPTGYLNQEQYQFLAAKTQDAYVVYLANKPKVVRRKTTRRKSSNNNGAGAAAFIGGVAAGLLLGR